MATYHVSQSGNDNNPGTYQSPFKTLQRSNTAVSAGDTVIVEDGTYTRPNAGSHENTVSNILKITKNGSAGQFITWKARNQHQAIIDGVNYNTNFSCIQVDPGYSYIRIEGFKIRRASYRGIGVTNDVDKGLGAHHVEIIDNYIYDIGQKIVNHQNGIVGVKTDPLAMHVFISGNIMHNIGRLPGGVYSDGSNHDYRHDHGVYSQGKQIIFENNHFYNCEAGFALKIDGHYSMTGLESGEYTHRLVGNLFTMLDAEETGGWIAFYNNRSSASPYGVMKNPRVIVDGNRFCGTPRYNGYPFRITDRGTSNFPGTIMQNNVCTHTHLFNPDPIIAANITSINNQTGINVTDCLEGGGGSEPNDPAQFTFDPSTQLIGSNPVTAGLFSFTGRTGSVDPPDTSEIVADATNPVGDKVWRLSSADDWSRYYSFLTVPSDSVSMQGLVLYRRNHLSYTQIIPSLRTTKTAPVSCYLGGAMGTAEQNSILRVAAGAVTTIETGAHTVDPIADEWVMTRFGRDLTGLKVRTWVYGETEPAWQATVLDSAVASGGAGFYAWLDGVDMVDPEIDIAWFSVGTEGLPAVEPEPVAIVEEKTVYFAVCPSVIDRKTGTPKISIGDNGAAYIDTPQTGQIGVGFRITYDTNKYCWIKKMHSQILFDTHDKTGGYPASIINADINSITAEFADLDAAETGIPDANHLNTKNLKDNNYKLKIPWYYDPDNNLPMTEPSTFDTGWVVTDKTDIVIYAPYLATECNFRQRHPGYRAAGIKYAHASTGNEVGLWAKVPMTLEGICWGAGITSSLAAIETAVGGLRLASCILNLDKTGSGVAVLAYLDGSAYGDVEIENCKLIDFYRGVRFVQRNTVSGKATLKINSSALYSDVSESDAVQLQNESNSYDLDMALLNSFLFADSDTVKVTKVGTKEVNCTIERSIASDSDLSTADPDCVGCLEDRTITDATAPGAGDFVVVEDITDDIDLRLKDHPTTPVNDAVGMHSETTGAGMTLPTTDIALKVRVAPYDCGPSEFGENTPPLVDILHGTIDIVNGKLYVTAWMTDLNGDKVQLKIQIDKVPTFDSVDLQEFESD